MKTTRHFHFRQGYPLSGSQFLGTLFIMAGVFALLSPLLFELEVSRQRVIIVGVTAILIGYVALFSYSGTKIDFGRNRFREYQSIAGIVSGEWQDMPTIMKVKVVSRTYLQSNPANGISPTLSGKVTDFYILLLDSDSTPSFSFTYPGRDKAIEQAKFLASCLNAEIQFLVSQEK